MKDGPIRKAVKSVALGFYNINLLAARRFRPSAGRRRFRLAGTCNGCGQCCESPTIKAGRLSIQSRYARILLLWWHRVVNGFEWIRTDRKSGVFIFRCTHYDPKTKLCDSYGSRPGMCRDYPRILFDAPIPRFLPECSYYAVDRQADRFKALLEQHDLPPEKREKLYRDLNLNE